MSNQFNHLIELNIIKEEPGKRIVLVQDLNTGTRYIKKELSHYNFKLWTTLQEINLEGICKIYSLDEVDGHLEIIEEYLDMPTLENIVSTSPLEENDVRTIIIKLCRILKVLHGLNPPIIHRDIKPSNILYDGTRVYLCDFDIARVYKQGNQNKDTTLLGSKGYAAPEHYGFGQTDHRSDIYSLGVLYNYLLTGKLRDEGLTDSEERELIVSMTNYAIDKRIQSVEEVEKQVSHILKNNNKSDKSTVKIEHWKYTLPGFRSKKPLHMILGTFYYILALFVSITVEASNSIFLESIIDKFFVFSWCIIFMFFTTNYLDIYDQCLFKNTTNKVLKIVGILLTCALIFIIDCIFFVVIYSLIKV